MSTPGTRVAASGAFGLTATLYGMAGIATLGGVSPGMIGGVLFLFAASGAAVGALGGSWVSRAQFGLDAIARSAVLTLGAGLPFVTVALLWAAVAQGFTATQVRSLSIAPLFAIVASLPATPFGALAGWSVWHAACGARGRASLA